MEVSEETLSVIIRNVPGDFGIYMLEDGSIRSLYISSDLPGMCGMNEEEYRTLSEKDASELVVDEDREKVINCIRTFIHDKKDCDIVYRVNKADRSTAWIHSRGRYLGERNGNPVFIVMYLDTSLQVSAAAQTDAVRSRQMYKTAVEAADLIVWKYDIQSRTMSVEDDAAAGKSVRSGMAVFEGLHPEDLALLVTEGDREKLINMFRSIDSGAPSSSCEVCFAGPSGQEQKYIHIICTSFFGNEGRPVSACCISRDITVQKMERENYSRITRELNELNPVSFGSFRLNLTKNTCGGGQSRYPSVMKQQEDGTVDGYLKAVGATIADGNIRKKFLSSCTRGNLLKMFHEGETKFTFDFPILFPPAGERRWAGGCVSMAQNPETGDVEAVSYSADITDKKEEEIILRTLTEKQCDFLGVIDPVLGTICFYAMNMSDQRPIVSLRKQISYDKAVNYALLHYVSADEQRAYEHATMIKTVLDSLEKKGLYAFPFSCIPDDNDKILHKLLQYSWLDSPGGKILLMQNDTTNTYEEEQKHLFQITNALESAQKANEAKTEFVSRISHDIRTPIGIISNMTNFAFEDIDNREKLRNDLLKIRSSNEFLLSLINDILDISKIDSGKIELHPAPYTIQDYIADIQNMFEPLCRSKNISFIIDRGPVEKTIVADHIRLNQIALNLLSNAVKYTMTGGTILLRTDEKMLDDGNAEFTMEVKDNGVGMSEEFQRKIFTPFTQDYMNPGRPKTVSGTGLGLSIVKRIVDLMNGTITVKSRIGKGTDIVVVFRFPVIDNADTAEKEKNGKSDAEPEQKIEGRILIAEDNPMNLEIALRMVESFGLSADTAENGKEALDKFAMSGEGGYKAILMDIQMPEMNGYEATEAIRKLSRKDAVSVPIIALTADAFSEAAERCRNAGMNAQVTKPVDPALLRKTLSEYMLRVTYK